MSSLSVALSFFFFNDTATTEIYTLSLHDALPISAEIRERELESGAGSRPLLLAGEEVDFDRSEEHTSELQSPYDLVCRLLLEKKNLNIALAAERRLDFQVPATLVVLHLYTAVTAG